MNINLSKTIIRVGTKALVALLFIGAGVAIAQTAMPSASPNNLPNIITPKASDLNEAPPPGSVREAKACSDDIKVMCALHTETRRDVADCLVDRKTEVSLSCKAYVARILDEENN